MVRRSERYPHPDDWVNPRGSVAKTYERVGKQAVWLGNLVAAWLDFHGGDLEACKNDPPYKLPKSLPQAERVNKAIKESGIYDRPPRPSDPTMRIQRLKSGELTVKRGNLRADDPMSIPAAQGAILKVPWSQVVDYWDSYGLDRDLEALLGFTPTPNREAVEKEMLA